MTPREWQVLGLLREGLTNEQIAERLDISFATARFHVSEIISKLGVGSRREAAAWTGRPKVAMGFAPLAVLLGKLRNESPMRMSAAAVLAASLALLFALALGVVLMTSRNERQQVPVPPPTIEPVIETEVIVFRPATVPADRRRSVAQCSTSGVLSREDAWRCGPGADPCFGEPGTLELICPLRPDQDHPGAFVLELIQPVVQPTPSASAPTPSPEELAREGTPESKAWWVETADGRMCGIKASGTSPVVNGERINFYCQGDDQNGLIGLPTPGKVWTARQVPLPGGGIGQDGVPEVIVELRTVWR